MSNKFGQYILKRPAKAGLFNIYMVDSIYSLVSTYIMT
jgi:hypothetical protein